MNSIPIMICWTIIIMIIITVIVWYYPECIFYPLNLLYRLDASPRTNFYIDDDISIIFPGSKELESLWEIIRDEGDKLYESLPDKNINYLDNYNIDLGNENKHNWTTIPLRLFGRDSFDYMRYCPTTTSILQSHPEIKSCLFSIMDAGKIIQPHIGPYDGLLRYQLALDIPTMKENEECYLHVGDERYYWTEGKGILFDEANVHGAVNTTMNKRMVLLIDIERPYYFLPYRLLNKILIWIMGILPATIRATLV